VVPIHGWSAARPRAVEVASLEESQTLTDGWSWDERSGRWVIDVVIPRSGRARVALK
jgi:hypothetical protein